MCGRKLFRTPIVLDFIPEAGSQTLWRGCGSSLLGSCGNRRSDKGLGQKATPTVPSAAHTTLCKHYSQRARSGIKRSGCAPPCLEPYWGCCCSGFLRKLLLGVSLPSQRCAWTRWRLHPEEADVSHSLQWGAAGLTGVCRGWASPQTLSVWLWTLPTPDWRKLFWQAGEAVSLGNNGSLCQDPGLFIQMWRNAAEWELCWQSSG